MILPYKDLAIEELGFLEVVQLIEESALGIERPPYKYKGKIVKFNQCMTRDIIECMRAGEVCLRMGRDDKPYSFVLVDAFGNIREKLV